MPKEVIRDRGSEKTHVSVGWHGGHTAQISVGLGKNFRFEESDGEVSDQLWYRDLSFTFDDRGQINTLIRNLRKARDAAFGADA